MSYGHSSSDHPSLDGVEFRLSEVFTLKHGSVWYDDFDLKDSEVVLEKLHYDFTIENHLLEEVKQKKEQEEEEERQNAAHRKEQEKKELLIKHKQKEEPNKTYELQNNKDNQEAVKKRISPSNPFFNDLVLNGILLPQPAPREITGKITNSKTPIDILDFENDNQDPFSNMELKSIDDLQELKDVLQNASSTTASGKQSPENHAKLEEHNHINIQPAINKSHLDESKSILIDQFTDLLTDDIGLKEDLPAPPQQTSINPTSHPPKKNGSAVLPQCFPASPVSGLLPPNTPAPDLHKTSPHTLQTVAGPYLATSSLSVGKKSPVELDQNSSGGFTEVFDFGVSEMSDPFANNSSKSSSSKQGIQPVLSKNNDASPVYVNITNTCTTNPVSKKPKPMPRLHATGKSKTSPKIEPKKKTYGEVKNKILVNKSASERAKFEDTINKALTSLPKVPRKSTKPQAMENSPSFLHSKDPKSPGVLGGLNIDEQDFVKSCLAMGFKENDVLRTMQKHGTDHKKVIEHLCLLQSFLEQNFKTKNIEEALDIFNGNVKETLKYLQLESQFSDMGFSSEKIKEALLLSEGNQQKALGVLMGDM